MKNLEVKMTKYLIRKSEEEEYELSVPEENPMKVGHWETVFSERFFSEFCYRLFWEIFPEIGENDHILYASTKDIMIAERACIDQALKLYKAMNSAKSTLTSALEKPESLESLLRLSILGKE